MGTNTRTLLTPAITPSTSRELSQSATPAEVNTALVHSAIFSLINTSSRSERGLPIQLKDHIEAHYDFIGQIVEQAVKKVSTEEKGWGEKLDDILTNRLLGIPIFLAIMYLLFELWA